MYFLGLDVGSSSIKAAILKGDTGACLASTHFPKTEMPIEAKAPGWAEQDPDMWWAHIQSATREALDKAQIPGKEIRAIGISYQMHGLVLVNHNQEVLRPSIIWCDSRAVKIGEEAFDQLGHQMCLKHYLNSPGNFTASKLKWVKDHEPHIYEQISAMMLPGDYVAMKMTGEVSSTLSGISEGILWDFKSHKLADSLLKHFDIDPGLIPALFNSFQECGRLHSAAAEALGLKAGIPVTYRAGDQPNNAFSLKVLAPGEVAATAGTSGVVYGISDQPVYDPKSRVNGFAHVNHAKQDPRIGILLCVNGTGILNSWLQKHATGNLSYDNMNLLASAVTPGADGLQVLPFGNGAERILENQLLGASLHHLDLNLHTQGHLIRAAHEGIAFAFMYGMKIMDSMGIVPEVIRAGQGNMFQSPVFREALAAVSQTPIELYNTDGAQGAARGAAIGAGFFSQPEEAFQGLAKIDEIEVPKSQVQAYQDAYQSWEASLIHALKTK